MRSPVLTIGLLLIFSLLLAAIVIRGCDKGMGGVVRVRSVGTTGGSTSRGADSVLIGSRTTAISLKGEELEKPIERSPAIKQTEWYKEHRRDSATTLPTTPD
jgi:hypothetical protein